MKTDHKELKKNLSASELKAQWQLLNIDYKLRKTNLFVKKQILKKLYVYQY